MKCLTLFCLLFSSLNSAQQQQKIEIRETKSPSGIIINVNEQAEAKTPQATKIKIAYIAGISGIVCSIITAAITLSVAYVECKP